MKRPPFVMRKQTGYVFKENGKCLTARISESPSQGSGCILSDILMEDVPEKYNLSQKQMEQLLYKSMLANREKESTQKKD